MGQFSWLDCITGEQIIDNKRKSVYVLVPKEFGGGHIREGIYDGYGRFGGKDIYELVAEWNREHLNPMMVWIHQSTTSFERFEDELDGIKKELRMMRDYRGGLVTDDVMAGLYGKDWKRVIGICIACYDEQNERLPFPIKITYDATAVYEDCDFSPSDPNQGWR